MKEFAQLTRLKESPTKYPSQKMLKELLDDHEKLIVELRRGIDSFDKNKDAGNTDFLTAL